jgi:hypothetical protein
MFVVDVVQCGSGCDVGWCCVVERCVVCIPTMLRFGFGSRSCKWCV